MTINNPLADNSPDHEDQNLVLRARSGDRDFIQAGYVDPQNLLFVRERIGEVREAAPKVHEVLSTLDEKCAGIFRGHPFYKAPDLAPMLRRLVARTHITM